LCINVWFCSSDCKPFRKTLRSYLTNAHTYELAASSAVYPSLPNNSTHHTTMADDTRQSGEQVAPPPPRAPANVMPGGTTHTAGGEKFDGSGPTYIDAVRSLGPEYYLNFHKRPCVRDSQLQGLSAGFAGGSLAAILGKPVYMSTNWAVATWCGVSVVSYQVCQYYRSKEKAGIKQAQELMEKKRATIEAKKEARRRGREQQEQAEQSRRLEEERRKSWSYWCEKNIKFW